MRDHGTRARYSFGPQGSDSSKGCRCDRCRAAMRDYERERKRRVAPAYVGADRARRHIDFLREHGVGLKQIAVRSGVSHGALSKLVYGDPRRGTKPSKRIRRSTEDAVLAVTANHQADGAHVPAGPTRVNIDTLVSRGWTKTAIARSIGVSPSNLLSFGASVKAAKARAVAALLDQAPPEPPTRTGHNAAAAKRAEEAASQTSERRVREPDVLPNIDPDVFDEPWRKRSACRLLAPEDRWIFWPGRGDYRTVKAAKDVCATCPVQADCLAFALEHHELGVWGGTSDRERRQMRSAA